MSNSKERYSFRKIDTQYINQFGHDFYYITMEQANELCYILVDGDDGFYSDWNTWFPIDMTEGVTDVSYSYQEIELCCFDVILRMRDVIDKEYDPALALIDVLYVEMETSRAYRLYPARPTSARAAGSFIALEGKH